MVKIAEKLEAVGGEKDLIVSLSRWKTILLITEG